MQRYVTKVEVDLMLDFILWLLNCLGLRDTFSPLDIGVFHTGSVYRGGET
jgi:hypothetical protein